jgi:hypothetical protein
MITPCIMGNFFEGRAFAYPSQDKGGGFLHSLAQTRIKEGCGGCGEHCTETTDLYENETQSIFIGASPS